MDEFLDRTADLIFQCFALTAIDFLLVGKRSCFVGFAGWNVDRQP